MLNHPRQVSRVSVQQCSFLSLFFPFSSALELKVENVTGQHAQLFVTFPLVIKKRNPEGREGSDLWVAPEGWTPGRAVGGRRVEVPKFRVYFSSPAPISAGEWKIATGQYSSLCEGAVIASLGVVDIGEEVQVRVQVGQEEKRFTTERNTEKDRTRKQQGTHDQTHHG